MAIPDIEAAVCPAVEALNLPKVPDAGYVRALGEVIGEIERELACPSGIPGLFQ